MSKGGDSGPVIPADPNADWTYTPPNLAGQAPAFMGYGYEAPMMQMAPAASQLPQMGLDPNVIADPTLLAALEILNRQQMVGQMPQMLGSGTQYQDMARGLMKDVAPQVAPAPAPQSNPFNSVLGLFGSNLFGGGN
jgi:hypothetical protein